MPIYKDNEAERLARIEQFLAEMRPKVTGLGPADHRLRRELGLHLDALLDEVQGATQRHRLTSMLMH